MSRSTVPLWSSGYQMSGGKDEDEEDAAEDTRPRSRPKRKLPRMRGLEVGQPGMEEEPLPPEEEEEDLDKEDGTGSLIDDIKAVLAEHEAEKADKPEEGEDKEGLPDFLKADEEEGKEEDPDKRNVIKFMPIVKIDSEQHKAYCIVAEPDVFDLQGDRSTAAEIEKASDRFMERLQKTCSPAWATTTRNRLMRT